MMKVNWRWKVFLKNQQKPIIGNGLELNKLIRDTPDFWQQVEKVIFFYNSKTFKIDKPFKFVKRWIYKMSFNKKNELSYSYVIIMGNKEFILENDGSIIYREIIEYD